MIALPRTLSLLVCGAALAGTMAGCVVTPASVGVALPYVTVQAPPPPQVEMVGVAPAPGYFWIQGNWFWEGGRHVWHPGRWEAPRPGYRWVPHRWERAGGGWREQPGHWDR
jgi:hypothetical protein